MLVIKKLVGRSHLLAGLVLLSLGLVSCQGLWREDPKKEPIARVGENYLYLDDLQMLLSDDMSPQDSASYVSNYINDWATKQLLLSKARINLTEEELEKFDLLVANYRTDLYTRAYKEALVEQKGDTTISQEQLESFYENEKDNFRLKEKLVKLRYAELPKQFLNLDEVTSKIQRFNEQDKQYLDSVGVQFKKLNFNDSLWVPVSRVIQEIPPINAENEAKYLNKSQFFQLEDSTGVYLGKVLDILPLNEIAPLSYIKPTIRHVLLNRRKLDYLRRLETEIIDEATKEKEFEVYEHKN
ncbi:peptidyl-prolyl cis-trans isomerase [Zeaxanthinibacter sp. PT1]|uniref:peptidyl-prolyl cis-trans isomerase n=1 Tax=Zeaxanthinibacter TaxID=561554 RepID=UPI0023493982|nr:peptidyl-prolyl cis-trans isomerase [Zeaxanthinibacter sp. PT1]MDC6351910.1 peptidyl-prolyl cis-trans isomerase [Zeaxanthinibacter sp. PT1]